MERTSKCLALILFIIFLTSFIVMSHSIAKAQTRILVVPDEYTTIQDAVGNASAGDTVYVKDGTYYVSDVRLTIDKPLSLVGQDRQATIIEFSGNSYYINSVIDITVDNVTLSGFTIIGNDIPTDIHLQGSNCKISNNIIENTSFTAIDAEPSENNVITSNSITNNGYYGIYFPSSDSIISNNTITKNNNTAIVVDSSENVTIGQNHISNNGNGILIRFFGHFYIKGNDIADNAGYGLQFGENCSYSIVQDNDLAHNQIGIDLLNFATTTNLGLPVRFDGYPLGTGNIVFNNRFIYNELNAKVEHSFPYAGNANNGTDVVSWDKGVTGNYWSDYNNPFAYVIDANNVDHHPLPYLSALIIVSITVLAIVLVVVVILLIYIRHRKTKSRNLTNLSFLPAQLSQEKFDE